MFDTEIEVEIRPAVKQGKVKAFADVRLILSDGEILINGFAVIKPDGKPEWVGFPQFPGRNKFFPVVEAKGRIEKAITRAVLDAFAGEEDEPKKSLKARAGELLQHVEEFVVGDEQND
jgi:hypothetical protein